MKKFVYILLLVSLNLSAQSYVHEASPTYTYPADSTVLESLSRWRDYKFGIILHWGLYSHAGIVESWQLTSEDWITPHPTLSYCEFKEWYFGLINEFNPTRFDPDQWAEAIKRAGAKYAIVTAKHHDGFCLFDTKTTSFSIAKGAFKDDERSDALKHIFNSLRKNDIAVGCYFSKPDWHCDYYWWQAKSTPNRYHNYSIEQYPDRWQEYQKFVYDQAFELMHNYGKIDVFWLDGGWCTAPKEDIRLDTIVAMARSAQEGLIVVERACPGEFEDYQTPEQKIPPYQITTPWESCITLTDDWGWTPKRRFKPAKAIVDMLCQIVAKGGSLLLGVGPTPEGIIDLPNTEILDSIGGWLDKNGESIYETTTTDIYRNDDQTVWFTASKDGKTLYALVPNAAQVKTIEWRGNIPLKGSKIVLLGENKPLKWSEKDGVVKVSLPRNVSPLGAALKIEIKR